MSDMLVKLYALPDHTPLLATLAQQQIFIRPAQTGERHQITEWVATHFNDSWAAGCDWSILRNPISCYIAVERLPAPPNGRTPYERVPPEQLIGFVCYDPAGKGIFGPLGVHPHNQKQGIGRALSLVALDAMKWEGYVYAIIGWAADPTYYAKAVGATLIPDSEPGTFGTRLITTPKLLHPEQ